MDSLQLREMLMQIGEATPCPFCKTKIPTLGIRLESNYESSCEIKFSCPNCKENFAGHAELRKIKTPLGKELNASSMVLREEKSPEEISKHEIEGMKNLLSQKVSFQRIFQTSFRKKKKTDQ